MEKLHKLRQIKQTINTQKILKICFTHDKENETREMKQNPGNCLGLFFMYFDD